MSLDIWLEVPERCPNCGHELQRVGRPSYNYTHNVTPMWKKAGVYDAFYRSDGEKVTAEYLQTLQQGVQRFEAAPSEFEKLNPSNRWGSARDALDFLKTWAQECEAFPDAIIRSCA